MSAMLIATSTASEKRDGARNGDAAPAKGSRAARRSPRSREGGATARFSPFSAPTQETAFMMKRKLMSEAAIANGLLAEETMTGANYRRLYLLPTNRLTAIFAKYGQPRKPQR